MSKDLMYKDEIQQLVVDAYRALDEPGGPGTRFYTDEQLMSLPSGVRQWALGVGNPTRWAELRDGDVVADVGSGAGIDTFLAAHAVGPTGRAIGVEILPEMIERAAAHAPDNAELIHAEMEALPLPDASVDVVISNGAINLSARKSRVLAEAYRVLRPGGRLCVADLTIREEELPSQILTHPSAWAG
jgi:arsenite methyltransferase